MLTAFDVVVAILVFISAILATARGLTREVLSLATWAGSAAIAVWAWQYHPDIARGYIREPIVADVATVIITFILSLIALHLITMRIADFVVDSKIGPLDRTLGFVFGGLRGILIAVIVVILGQWLQWGGMGSYIEGSKTEKPLASLGESLIRTLPQNAEDAVSDFLGDNNQNTDLKSLPNEEEAEEGTDSGEVPLNS